MNPKIIVTLIPLAMVLGLFIALLVLLYGYRLSRKGQRSPLTRNLLRSPGESLRTQIEAISEKIDYYLMVFLFFPLVIYTIYLTQKYIGGMKDESSVIGIYTIASAVIVVFCFIRLWSLLRQRTFLRLGLDCELAVGQELNNLMIEGYRVYHDFPAEGFNIDHIVVGPKGIFAIETKGRAKPDRKDGEEGVKVSYNGTELHFPERSERKPVEQAKAQASWLSQWLSSAVGERVAVRPVLAIPGWFLVNEGSDSLLLFSGKTPGSLLNAIDGSFDASLIQRIVHQLEQRCRDIEPVAYSKKAKGK